MSFQAYLDAVEIKTGKTPREIVDLAKAKGFDDSKVKAGQILDWLKSDSTSVAAMAWPLSM